MNNSDYVSRGEVTESVYQALGEPSSSDDWRRIRRAIRELPAADVRENVRGEWIIEYDPGSEWYKVTCSECGEDVTSQIPMIGSFPYVKTLWDYCHKCGADNRPKTTSADRRV